jgi:hypothetical protein
MADITASDITADRDSRDTDLGLDRSTPRGAVGTGRGRRVILAWIFLQLAEIATLVAVVMEMWGFFFGPNEWVYPAGISALVLLVIIWFVPWNID